MVKFLENVFATIGASVIIYWVLTGNLPHLLPH